MNVALATSTASRPFAFMTARNGDAVEKGADTRTPPSPEKPSGRTGDAVIDETDPLTNRFPTIAFSYDVDASRLVMQYRDPANGKTVSQIPTEAALKQYKEAQQQEKAASRASTVAVTVGGPPDRDAPSSGGAAPGSGPGPNKAAGKPAVTPAASSPTQNSSAGPSTGSAHVAHFTPATSHPASVSTGVARVNVVI